MQDENVFFDLIDRIVCLDLGGRGVAGLFEPARALVDGPLSLAAANHLADIKSGDAVFIITGSLTRASVSPDIAENDGPIGAAVLHGLSASDAMPFPSSSWMLRSATVSPKWSLSRV